MYIVQAVSAQTISQAIARYEELGIVQYRKSKSVKPIPLIALHPDYTPRFKGDKMDASGRLHEFLERVSSFRREGKDRRDADDVVGDTILTVISRNYPSPVEVSRPESENQARM
jgi:hypothetical protein